jgi:hypothetical protein
MKYLLSPQDLMALELVPQLMAAGVSCLKIEGRLKGPEYVALTTAAYRGAVDAAWASAQAAAAGGGAAGGEAPPPLQLGREERWRLEQVRRRRSGGERARCGGRRAAGCARLLLPAAACGLARTEPGLCQERPEPRVPCALNPCPHPPPRRCLPAARTRSTAA